jgi:hypothetical protein
MGLAFSHAPPVFSGGWLRKMGITKAILANKSQRHNNLGDSQSDLYGGEVIKMRKAPRGNGCFYSIS